MKKSVPETHSDQFRNLPLAAIAISGANPRRYTDQAALQELARSIREKGVLEPILVRPVPQTKPGKNGHKAGIRWEIVCGERRWRASATAKKSSIPAIVREMDDRAVLECQVIENLQRADVHFLDEAEGYHRLSEMDKGFTPQVLAEKVGKSETYIRQRLQLLKLEESIKKQCLTDHLNVAVASRLARLQPKDQVSCLKDIKQLGYRTSEPSARMVEQWTQTNVLLDLGKAPFKTDDSNLLPAAGPCTLCPKRTGFAPSLFPEVKSKDTCTDPVCFKAKTEALIQLRVNEEPDTRKVYIGQPHYGEKLPAGVTTFWNRSGKGECENTRRAVVAHAESWDTTKKAGDVIWICTDKNCGRHRGGSSSSGSSGGSHKDRCQVLDEAAKRNHELAKRRAVWAATCVAVRSHLVVSDLLGMGEDDLRFIASELAHNFDYHHIKELDAAWGIEGSRDSVQKRIGAADKLELLAILFDMAFVAWRDSVPYRDGRQGGDALAAQAKRWGVDVKAVAAPLDEKYEAMMARRRETRKKKAEAEKRKHRGRGVEPRAQKKAEASA
ncbi:MAG TPA: ParB/RepB/Spo0J family partition protein [Candidatus Acidoferrales bacterium]|nr:ParB/RepB/Spo0J family partition protein [Candidatus Acidoferrales bacterium]